MERENYKRNNQNPQTAGTVIKKLHTMRSRFTAGLATAALAIFMLTPGWGQTPYVMSGGNYSENFNDIANWTTNFVSGIGANRWGSVAVNLTGTVGDGVRISTSTATFTTTTTAGVQKGTANIYMLSTSTANSCAIDLFLDFTGRNAGTISFDVATVFNSTGDRDSKLKLFYSTNGTTFTEITGTNLPFTARNNVALSASITNITLPSAFNNSATARLRFYEHSTTTGGTPAGSQPKISIDNIAVTSTASGSSTPPSLTAAAGATVDAPFDVTFTDDAAWRAAITSIKVGATTLTAGSSVSAGQITFTPSASAPANLLQTAGTPTITVVATGYTDATVAQAIGAGAATKLAMVTQPTTPAVNGGVLATQPVVRIQDQYSNTTTSTATVDAAVGAGTWTLGGTTSVAGIAGTVTYSGLTATSAAAVTGATIAFSSTGLTGVTSGTFNIPAPAPANDLCGSATTLTIGAAAVNGTLVSSTFTAPFSKKDVWYSFTPTCTGSHIITVTGFTGDVDVEVFYNTNSCPSSTAYSFNAATTNSTETINQPFTAGSTYYIRVFAFNTTAETSVFTIGITAPTPVAQAVTSNASTLITATTASLNGNLTTLGICPSTTEKGFVYSLTSANSDPLNGGTGVTKTSVSGLTTGAYTLGLTSLTSGTQYSFKAYVYNGTDYTYGSVTTFSTVIAAPVATAGTAITSTSFDANWNAVTGATDYRLDVSTNSNFLNNTTIATEGFENAISLFAGSGGTFYSGNSGTGDLPASSPFAVAGTYSYGISNGTAILTSSDVNTSLHTSNQLSFRLASFSINSSGNGADAGDIVTVEISPNGGTNYYSTVRVLGNSNAVWSYAGGAANASTTYDGDATPVNFAPRGGGNRTTDGYSTVTVTGLPSSSNLKIRITLLNSDANERWLVDDLKVTGNEGDFVSGYNNLTVNATSQSVSGLTSNTTYYYRVRAVDATSTSANSNVITVLTVPGAFEVTGGGSYCTGGTEVSVGLAGSQLGVNYQLYRDATAVGSLVAGTGSALDFGLQTTSGSYTVKGTNASGTTDMTSSATVTINPLPDAAGSISGPTSVVQGNTGRAYSVPSITNATSYFWAYSGTGVTINGTSASVTLDFSSLATSGNLTVYGVNACGNGTISTTYAITVTSPTLWAIMLTTGKPVTTRFLGDQLNASGNYYINFEIGQAIWNQSFSGIGKSNTDPTTWDWRGATWYEDGPGSNKRVRADFGNFQFTSTGNWFINGRAQNNVGEAFNYANSTFLVNTTAFAPTEYITVNALTDPSAQTATPISSSQINLAWTRDATPHNVMIVRKISTDSWTEPTQGTPYAVSAALGAGVIVYNGSGTTFSDTGLLNNTTYNYKFYSENYSYYSAGVLASATALDPPVINSALTASGTEAVPFTYTITATNTPTSYSATGLPPGLSVASGTGIISGTPTLAGTYNVSLSATNATGTGNATLVITIDCYTATSETAVKTSYAEDIVTIDGRDWLLYQALIGNVADDYKIGSKSIRLISRIDTNLELLTTLTNGLGSIGFKYSRYGTNDPQATFRVEYTKDNGNSWIALEDITADDTVKTFSATVNESAPSRVRIRYLSGTLDRRFNIDNIVICPYKATQEIEVTGNNTTIINGSTTTTFANHTVLSENYFVNDPAVERTYTVTNYGSGTLTLSNPTISGATEFTVSTLSATTLTSGASATFTVSFSATTNGLKEAIISIANDDSNENPYTFKVSTIAFDYTKCTLAAKSTIAQQDFEDTPATPTLLYTAGANLTSIAGTNYGTDRTTPSNMFIGAKSLVFSGAASSFTTTALDVSNYENITFAFRLGAYGSTISDGMDTTDNVTVAISKDNGATWVDVIKIKGYNNAISDINTSTGTAREFEYADNLPGPYNVYMGENSTNTFANSFKINKMPKSAQLQIRFSYTISLANEFWSVDNLLIEGQLQDIKTWDGSVWDGGGTPPSTSQKAIIDGNYSTATANLAACACKVNADKTLTVLANDHVILESDIINNGTIIVEHQGSLAQKNNYADVSGTGTYQIKKNTGAYRNYDYIYWSSPVDNETFGSVFSENPAGYKYKFVTANYWDTMSGEYVTGSQATAGSDGFDDNGNDWQSVLSADVIQKGVGYIVLGKGSVIPFNATTIAGTQPLQSVVFDGGKVNNGEISVAVSLDKYNAEMGTGGGVDAHLNTNFLGKPYPSAIDIKELKARNPLLTGTFYFWTHDLGVTNTGGPNAYDFYNTSYASVTTNGTTITGSTNSGTNIPAPEYIASAQGFMANVSGNGTITFSNTMRVTGNNNTFLRQADVNPISRVWLNMTTSDGLFRQIMVGFMDGANDGFAEGEDGPRMESGITDIYTLTPNADHKLAIQLLATFADDKTIPLGLKTVHAGTYAFAIDHSEGIFANGQKVYIQDNQTGIVHDLSLGAYSFTSTAGAESNDRFVLRFTGSALGIDANTIENLVVYPNPSEGKFYMNYNGASPLHIEVYDLTGKQLIGKTATNSGATHYTIDLSGYQSGIYLAKITSEGKTVTKKLVIE